MDVEPWATRWRQEKQSPHFPASTLVLPLLSGQPGLDCWLDLALAWLTCSPKVRTIMRLIAQSQAPPVTPCALSSWQSGLAPAGLRDPLGSGSGPEGKLFETEI